MGSGGAFLLILATAASYQIWNARKNVLAESHEQAVRFMAGAEASLNRSLLGVDVLLAGTDELLKLSDMVPEWVNTKTASQLLRSTARQNLMVRFVALLDSSGRVFASSNLWVMAYNLNCQKALLRTCWPNRCRPW